MFAKSPSFATPLPPQQRQNMMSAMSRGAIILILLGLLLAGVGFPLTSGPPKVFHTLLHSCWCYYNSDSTTFATWKYYHFGSFYLGCLATAAGAVIAVAGGAWLFARNAQRRLGLVGWSRPAAWTMLILAVGIYFGPPDSVHEWVRTNLDVSFIPEWGGNDPWGNYLPWGQYTPSVLVYAISLGLAGTLTWLLSARGRSILRRAATDQGADQPGLHNRQTEAMAVALGAARQPGSILASLMIMCVPAILIGIVLIAGGSGLDEFLHSHVGLEKATSSRQYDWVDPDNWYASYCLASRFWSVGHPDLYAAGWALIGAGAALLALGGAWFFRRCPAARIVTLRRGGKTGVTLLLLGLAIYPTFWHAMRWAGPGLPYERCYAWFTSAQFDLRAIGLGLAAAGFAMILPSHGLLLWLGRRTSVTPAHP